MTVDIQALKNRMATQATAQNTAASQETKQPEQAEQNQQTTQEERPKSNNRVFHGEFGTFQQYLTGTGKIVAFYKGYCVTADPEIAEYCARLKVVQELTGKVNEEDLPVVPKRERSRNWASAQGTQPHVFSPADLLQRAVRVANTSNSVPAMQSTSSN